MNFGLNLILTMTNRASGGMREAANQLAGLYDQAQMMSNSLSNLDYTATFDAMSRSAGMVGDSLINVGTGMTGMFTGLVNNVMNVGSEFESFGLTLNTLYGDANKASGALNKLLTYAAKTPFEVEDIKDMLVVLQSNGIDAFKDMTGEVSGLKQETLSWLGDIMAFKPDIPATRWRLAFTNFLGSGAPKVLENALDMGKITDTIGHELGDTAEERMKSLVEFIEKKNVGGLMQNMFGSWGQAISNLDDIVTMFYKKIADTGAFKHLEHALLNITGVIEKLDKKGYLDAMAQSIGDGVNAILGPTEALSKRVADLIMWFGKFTKEHPKLGKMVVLITTLTGVGLVAVGVFFKLVSMLGSLALSINGITALFGSSTQAGVGFFGMLKSGVSMALSRIAPLALLFAGIAVAWHTDLFGMQTMITQFTNNIITCFSAAREAVNMNTDDMISYINGLDRNDFFDNLTVGIMKFMLVFSALKEGWKDYTISVETYEKLQALGLAELVGRIFDFKARVCALLEGFKTGWKETSDVVRHVIERMASSVKGTRFEGFFNMLEKFFNLISSGSLEQWEHFGEVIGRIAPILLSLALALKLFKKAAAPVQAAGGLFSFFGGRGGAPNTNNSLVGSLSSSPLKTLKMMANIALVINGVTLITTALGAISSIPGFDDFLNNGIRTLTKVFSVIGQIAVIAGGMGLLITAFDKLNINPKTSALGMANIAILLGGLDLIITAIGALNSIPGFADFLSKGANTMGKIGTALESFFSPQVAAVFLGIAAFGAIPVAAAAKGIANVIIILGGMTALITAFGALSHIGGFNSFIQTGGESLALLFEQIGKIAGSAVGGFAEGTMSTLPQIGNYLAEFGNNIKPFFNAIKDQPLGQIGSFAAALGAFVLELKAADVLSFFTGDNQFDELAEQLTGFGKSIQPFFDSISRCNDTGLEKAPKVFGALGKIGNMEFKSGGLLQKIIGEQALDKVGQQLADFSTNGETFFNSVARYSDEGIEKAPKVFNAIGGLGNLDFKSGGLLQKLTGELALDTVGEQLSSFAEKGKDFFNKAADFSDDGLSKAPKIFSALAGIGNLDFKSGGLLQAITGDLDLTMVGQQLTGFAERAKKFFEIAGEIEVGNGLLLMSAIARLGEIDIDTLEDTDVLISVGTNLTQFGNNIKGFFDTANSMDPGAFLRAQLLFQSLRGVSDVISIAESSGGRLRNFGTELKMFGNDFNSFSVQAGSINSGGITLMGNALKTLANAFDATAGRIRTGVSSIQSSLRSLAASYASTSNQVKSETEKMGTAMATFATKVSTETNRVKSSLSSMTSAFSSAASSISGSMSSAASGVSVGASGMVSVLTSAKAQINTIVGQINSILNKLNRTINTNINVNKTTTNRVIDIHDKRAVGGVFNKATNIQVGEDGAEVVMPLEKNTGWITGLAQELRARMGNMSTYAPQPVNISQPVAYSDVPVPVATQENVPTPIREQSVINPHKENTSTSKNNVPTNMDNSVTFAPGSIVIHAANASESEMQKMAEYIMAYIERKRQLDNMSNYGMSYR